MLTAILGWQSCGEGTVEIDPVITGQLESSFINKLVTIEKLGSQQIELIDTIRTDDNGKFVAGFDVPQISFYRLSIDKNNFVNLVLSPGEKVEFQAKSSDMEATYTVNGSPESERLKILNRYLRSVYITQDSLNRAIRNHQAAKDVNAYFGAMQHQNKIQLNKTNFLKGFIDEKPEFLVNLAAVENLDPEQEFDYYKKVLNALGTKYAEVPYVINLENRVKEMGRLAVGSEAPDISLPDTKGNIISLHSLRGKVVLVDFWASWCRPCRAENPNVVKVYNKYKNKGFDILSVSLDKSKDKWVQAIQQDGLIWSNHISDLAYWNSSVVKQYNVKGIPLTYLIDADGKIIAKNLRGPKLEEKLKEIFNG